MKDSQSDSNLAKSNRNKLNFGLLRILNIRVHTSIYIYIYIYIGFTGLGIGILVPNRYRYIGLPAGVAGKYGLGPTK